MQVLSKLANKIILPEWSFPYNCYEVGHTWEPSCTWAIIEITQIVFEEALRMYGSLSVFQFVLKLYFVRQERNKLCNKRYSKFGQTQLDTAKISEITRKAQICSSQGESSGNDEKLCDESNAVLIEKTSNSSNILTDYELIKKLTITAVKSWLRSSTFLGLNAFFMFGLFCFVSRISGKFYYSVISVVPAALGSLMAIQFESPARQNALSIYVANIASEVIYNMGLSREYYRSYGDYGTALLFAGSISFLLYQVKKKGYGKDPFSIALKLILSKAEKPNVARSSSTIPHRTQENHLLNNERIVEQVHQTQLFKMINNDKSPKWTLQDGCNDLDKFSIKDVNNNYIELENEREIFAMSRYYKKLIGWLNFDFKHESCMHEQPNCIRYVLESSAYPFMAGYVGQCLFAIAIRPKTLLVSPFTAIKQQFFSFKNINTAFFLGLFAGSFKAMLCTFRWITGKSQNWHVAASGFAAGLFNIYAPNSTLSTYILWKAIECLYIDLYKKGMMPSSKYISPLLYALSVNTIFYAGILEPYQVRPSYGKFLERITHNKIHLMNRSLLAVFGTKAYIGYEDFWPDIDPQYCSNKFVESVTTWKIGHM